MNALKNAEFRALFRASITEQVRSYQNCNHEGSMNSSLVSALECSKQRRFCNHLLSHTLSKRNRPNRYLQHYSVHDKTIKRMSITSSYKYTFPQPTPILYALQPSRDQCKWPLKSHCSLTQVPFGCMRLRIRDQQNEPMKRSTT